jgi:mannose-1-phosphate guanylyltransferase
MPEPLLSINVDTTALRATLTRIGAEFDRELLAVAHETARAIAAEARRRMPQSAKRTSAR